MLKVGEGLQVQTKTHNDIYGTVIYKVLEINKKCPFCGEDDGILFIMLGGTGPVARAGVEITDCSKLVAKSLDKNLANKVEPHRLVDMEKYYKNNVTNPSMGQEIDI